MDANLESGAGDNRPVVHGTARGFSLIELLVVVSIILILTGLLMPAVKRMINQSGRGKAAAQAVAFANAVKAYRSTYGSWPGQTQGALDNVVQANVVLSALTNNTRKINFLEPKDNWIRGGYLVDGWGRALNVAMDENGDGKVSVGSGGSPNWTGYALDENGTRTTIPGASFTATTVSNATVLVHAWGHAPQNSNSWVMSWMR